MKKKNNEKNSRKKKRKGIIFHLKNKDRDN